MDWQTTATTVNCEYVTDFATIMIRPDGTVKCSVVNRHSKAKDGNKKRLRSCKWPDCPLVDEFRKRALTM